VDGRDDLNVMTAKCDDVRPEESEAVAGGMVE
jgi:hypothetical protein